jgi:hypothetical protein
MVREAIWVVEKTCLNDGLKKELHMWEVEKMGEKRGRRGFEALGF